MELLGIEVSRIILLAQVQRPTGQLYLPDVVEKLVGRYAFVKVPSPDQSLPLVFSIGKFRDSQISELSIYNDGLVVSSASPSDLLDEFLDDLLAWAFKEFSLVASTVSKSEKFYESNIIVKSGVDLAKAIAPPKPLSEIFDEAIKSAKIEVPIESSGFVFDFDPAKVKGKRKPFRFLVDRRVGEPFSENIFYSQAPFRTQDHLKVLKSIEEISKHGI